MDWLVRQADAAAADNEPGRASALLLRHRSMTLRWYAPKGHDPQSPHDQDEIYIVATGRGTFALRRDEASLERAPFAAGDAIFVPAGWVHRFEDFSGDFGTRLILWGPRGGETGHGCVLPFFISGPGRLRPLTAPSLPSSRSGCMRAMRRSRNRPGHFLVDTRSSGSRKRSMTWIYCKTQQAAGVSRWP